MAEVIRMPRMSDTMTEGTFVEWHKKVGDIVKPGDILAEVETDKATMELENYVKGTLLYVGVAKGAAAKVDQIIAIVGKDGEDFSNLLNEKASETITSENGQAEKKMTELNETIVPEKESSQIETLDEGRLKASPLAKKIAEEKGINISAISGSGPEGRIIKKDVENFIPQKTESVKETKQPVVVNLPKFVGEESYEEVPVSQMRKTIAARLSQSKFTSPHFYLTVSINMDNAIAAKKSMNAIAPLKISFNDMVIKATALSLRQHPQVNSSWMGDNIRMYNHIHIGVAVAISEGLLVPVVRFADKKSLSHIAAEVNELAEKAKNRKLQPQDWEGNTFTISNLGMMGIEEFTAIINPPDACILAVGGINEVPIVKNGQITSGNMMKMTMSCDHRVVDGAVGAKFLQTLRSYLEDPVRMLI
ncbi:MAG: pyruvate dehydrogenase complex dihydrolipoamide acetyltransferase [Chitinophagales bacterium]